MITKQDLNKKFDVLIYYNPQRFKTADLIFSIY